MSVPVRYTDYDDFAWLYNRYWSKRLIDQIYGTIEAHLLAKLRPGDRILDICCGNGHLAARLAADGFRVSGIDGSEPMLAHARENAPDCQFDVADACTFSRPGMYDAAVSTCDSLNHIMSLPELKQAFRNAYEAIRPGGCFSFDLNTEAGYRAYWTGRPTGRAEEDHAFVLTLSYDESRREAVFAVALFRRQEGKWRRSDVRLTQRYYPREDVLTALRDVGFRPVTCYDVEKDLGVEGTGRMMFICGKPEQLD